MTFGELKAETRRRLAEVHGPVFWTDDDIADALNLGYEEVSDETEWCETWHDVALLEDRPYYDVRTNFGPTDNFLAVKPAFDRQTNRWLIPSTVRYLDMHDRRWERVTGEPQRIFRRGLFWLAFYPRIQSDVGTIKVHHSILPDPLEDDEDEPGFPDLYHTLLVDFAMADLWAQDAEAELALAAWALYLDGEAKLRNWVQSRAGIGLMHGVHPGATSVQS